MPGSFAAVLLRSDSRRAHEDMDVRVPGSDGVQQAEQLPGSMRLVEATCG